jgi:hypothetical protein
MPTMQQGTGHYDRWAPPSKQSHEGFSGVNLAPTREEESARCACPACTQYHTDPHRTCRCTGGPLCAACAHYARTSPLRSNPDAPH